MQDEVREYYEKMLKARPLPSALVETYNQTKLLSDRLDGGDFNARELAFVAILSGCSPYSGEGAVDPPRNMDFVPSPTDTPDPWVEGAPCEVDWNGTQEATFVCMSGDQIRVKFKDETVRDIRPSRVKMLVST